MKTTTGSSVAARSFSSHAGVCNPHAATAEKGQQFMDALVERLAPFLVELSEAELDERFPY